MTEEKESIYLYPAALVVPRKPAIVHTILGSCVAVCLYDIKLQYGGINHYMLPFWNGQGLASPKYGNIAIEKLYEKMINYGTRHENLIAKVFGGGEVLQTSFSYFNVGERNVHLANELLAKLKIPIVAHSTGGKLGRKIIFNSNTGEISQRFVKSTTSPNTSSK
ncbi:MAG: chemotaxis protein CheD [Bacteroidales bacterium]|nr:chemotaxis protein CheD [Bacteroidales bacterium]MBN2820162.1 chemotaxis protein CheD [Bacteroidales bacterium]